jgi:hypothetical protein
MSLENRGKRRLSDKDLVLLRQRGLLREDETAYWVDSQLIAENVFNSSQRELAVEPTIQLESRLRVLRG